MIYVAQNSKEAQRVPLKEIARGTDAPEHFVAKIMQDLGKKKLVKSVKGPNGGFFMDEEDLKTSLADIVKAIDGDGIYLDCVLGLKTCSEKNPCPVHFYYKDLKKNLIKLIETNTIGDFHEKLESGKYFLKNS